MKEGQKLWTRDELILAINLYCKLPFGKMHSRNKDIIELGGLIDRSSSAVARKLGNFASMDPNLKARNVGGLPNAGQLTEDIWNEFYNNWDAALLESEMLLAKTKHTTIEQLNEIDETEFPKGLTKERLIMTRVNQHIFRKMVLATYNNKCCITGMDNTELLVASHIVAWGKDEKNRLNPMNGLCLNALHDRAFDKFLITVSAEDYTIRVSSKLKKKNAVTCLSENFFQLEGQSIVLPDKFLPDKELLKKHNEAFI